MPVRLRITLLFAVISLIILALVCSGIYYFSYSDRRTTIETRLTNRALTTARLLAQKENFDRELVQRIDSLTTISLKNKTVEAYDYQNKKIYSYSDVEGDTLQIEKEILDDARVDGKRFFQAGNKEAVAYHYSDAGMRIVVVSAGEDIDGKRSLHVLFNILVVSLLAGTFLVLVAGLVFSARLLTPIKKITSEVNEISAQNLARRLDTGGAKDEWYHLADTFNRLLNRLQESFDLQRRFISNASHELSTPLTSISSQLEVSLQRDRKAEEYKQVMHSIHQDVKHMSKLTQTLLEFAQASGNTGGLEIDLLRIDEIIFRLHGEIPKVNSSYSMSLQFGKLPENEQSLLVFGNEALLYTALKNIIINACKYSADHKAVVLLEVLSETIQVSVLDKGRGIGQDEIKNIFQPFYRVHENSPSGGFGLGLSLAERIIKLHKGRIMVHSETGKGTRFDILIPPASSLR